MAEAIDGLELVADEEDLVACDQVDQLALEAVRVLELVHQDRAEAPARVVADLLVQLQKGAGLQLQVFEVECRLASLRLGVGRVELTQDLLEESAVARGDLVQSRLLDRGQGLAEGGEALPLLPAHAEIGEIEEVLGRGNGVEQLQGVLDLRAAGEGLLSDAQRDLRDLAQLGDACGERRDGLARERERPPGRAQAVMDAREHPAQPLRPVRGEEAHSLRPARLDVAGECLRECLRAQDRGLALVEHTEAWVEAGLERMRAQQAVAEAVDRRDPAAVEVACEIVALRLHEPLPDPRAQLAGRTLRVRDDEDVVDAQPALADGLHKPLDEHRRLARPGAGRDEDHARLLDRRNLLVGGSRPHECRILHIVQREHQRGHSPPRGSVRTSPACIRSTARRARACASSTWCQKSSSET